MPLHKIQKRNGAIVDFDIKKIEQAIYAALQATGTDDMSIARTVAKDVYKKAEELYADSVPMVEQLQDIVEEVLIKQEYVAAAKAYILYRAKHGEDRKQKNVIVEVGKTVSEYLDKLDWRVNANSNQGYSLGGMILNTSGKVTANYWLSHILPQSVGDTHRNGDFHVHDLDMFSGYCAGWSLRALLEEGFNGVQNKIESGPPKHLSSAVAQMINFLGTLQNEWAGAQAFSSFDTYMAPFVKKYELELREEIEENGMMFASDEAKEAYISKKVYDYVYQNIQSFVFNLNIPSRWGTQTPFTNITLDWTVPDDLKDKQLILGGKIFPYTFGELKPQMDLVNKAFIEVMTKGDSKGRTFTFPIPTYNITKDFDWEDEKALPLFEMTAKYGTPYFQNFLNSDLKPSDVRSMCCRLQLDLKELKKRGGGLFGSAEMTGSIGVVTINAARIGYTQKGDKKAYFERLGHLMDLAKTSLELKRIEIQKWMDRGLFPYTKRYLGTLSSHFSTIGINGINESIRNFTDDKENITTKEGQKLALEILDFMREKLQEYQEETGNLYNLEATPAEGTTYRFAREDQKRFGDDILQAGTKEAPYYTNSSQIPVGYTDDLFEALDLQDELQTKYTGGTVFHCYMSERLSTPEACRNLVKKALENYHLPYITISPTFSICPKHGYIKGEFDFCPVCDEELGFKETDSKDHEFRKQHTSSESHK
ncbi:ribonucleoside triphosphate reductase [Patescibacteria group bacterium]|nr:ribonucleoside triphosphate reductase [Patescibacteria group bacterium]MBU1721665.1 ribonucleoside triphosphate reductase [Patescibacteria group bacterium]MBU1900974.1 ribonucleoside triphosphate reductase [Patescibacteria group bacterium]